MGATLVTVANDVKLQVEFNPSNVDAYRLIGYENRMLDDRDFQDDTKDAGEIGAGHSIVALYEITPVGGGEKSGLKYQQKQEKTEKEDPYSDEFATVSVRYKNPGESQSWQLSFTVSTRDWTETPDDDFVFASLVAEFAMILSDSPYKGTATLDGIMDTYAGLETDDEYKEEFYQLVRMMAKRQ